MPLELNESIRASARRYLKKLSNFQSVDQAVVHLPAQVQPAFAADEELLGIYRNSESDPHANLVFTTRGVYKFSEQWICAEYAQMGRLNVPGQGGRYFDKQTAATLVVQVEDGHEVVLTISGAVTTIISGHERRFPDLWQVLIFLDRVMDRIKRE